MLSHFSRVQHFVTPWTLQPDRAFLAMGFFRQEYWSGLPFPPPGDPPNPGIEPVSPILAGGFSTTKSPGSPQTGYLPNINVSLLSFKRSLTQDSHMV